MRYKQFVSPTVLETAREFLGTAKSYRQAVRREGMSLVYDDRQEHPLPGNTFIDALAALARYHESWLRPLEVWLPRTHNVRRQFASLARHLLAKYPVPGFLDSVWFKGQTAEGQKQQEWFIAIACGTSPRKLALPLRLTKRMVHHFLRAPSDYTVEAALRWGQVLGLGGNVPLVQAILGSKLASDFSHEDFWASIIGWLIAHPMLARADIGPLVDYIQHRKFETEEAAVSPDQSEVRLHLSDFSIQGRTPVSLLREMQRWHGGLRKQPEQESQTTWEPCGIAECEWTEGAVTSPDERRWTIKEILSWKGLFDEGRLMRHCVAIYEPSCASGESSIWSLGIERPDGRRKRAVTIEVAIHRKVICQARGRANRIPAAKEMEIIRRWAAKEGLTVDSSVRSR